MSEVGLHIIMLHTKPDIRFSNQALHNNKFACPVNEWEKLSYSVDGIGLWIIERTTEALDCYECLVVSRPCQVREVDTCKHSRYYTFLSRRL